MYLILRDSVKASKDFSCLWTAEEWMKGSIVSFPASHFGLRKTPLFEYYMIEIARGRIYTIIFYMIHTICPILPSLTLYHK